MLLSAIHSAYIQKRFLGTATPAMVRSLRERTGAPMMDCKKALEDKSVDGDINRAIDWLRAKGIARATSESTTSRAATEGLIGVKRTVKEGKEVITLVEINSETDFVARNKDFQDFVASIVNTVSNYPSQNKIIPVSDVSKLAVTSSTTEQEITVQERVGEAVSKIRENLVIRRALNISAVDASSILGIYLHGKVQFNSTNDIQLGRSAGVVEVQVNPSSFDSATVNDIIKKLAMHIVAAKPSFLRHEEIPKDLIEKEIAIFREQTAAAEIGKKPKPAEVTEKIIAGKVSKRLAEITLMEQNHVADEAGMPIQKHLEEVSKKLGSNAKLSINRFYLWTVGQ